jgi:hypothetical protein
MDGVAWSSQPGALLDGYVQGPERLVQALAELHDSDLDLALSEDTWSIRQIVHHIVDGDDLWKMCTKAALGGCPDAPGGPGRAVFGLHWYWDRPQDEWVERWAYATRAIKPSLALFEANRRHVTELLQTVPDAWTGCITVRWPSGQEQEVTVGWIVEMQTRHVVGHIDDILRIRIAHGLLA